MRVVLLVAPAPIAQPSDVVGIQSSDHSRVVDLIASAQAQIDGPTGWLNRSLGVQTIEVSSDRWPSDLPCRPILDLVSVEVDGKAVSGVTVSRDGRLKVAGACPSGSTVIRYRAGYDGDKNGPVPANAKAAVVLLVQDLLAASAEHGGLRSVGVDGAFSEAYNAPDQVQRGRVTSIESLLSSLRVYV